LKIDDVPELRSRLNKLALEQLTAEDYIPVTWLDSEIRLESINLGTLDQLNLLSPFGVDNPKPKFLVEGVHIANMRKIGSDSTHLKLTIEEKGANLDGVGFGLGSLADHISPVEKLSLIGELTVNEWNNIRKPQIFIQDIAVKSWQLFDYRGGSRIKNLRSMVPAENRKWIFFDREHYEKFTSSLEENETFLIDTKEQAEAMDISQANLVFVDLPTSEVIIYQLIQGKLPARIYACFLKKSSDFLSTFPTRDHFKWFYAFLLQQGTINLTKYGDVIAKKRGWTRETIFFMSRVFYELDFVTINNGLITLTKDKQKRDLTDSKTYRLKQEQYSLENELLFSSFQQLKNWFNQYLDESVINEEAIKEWI
jgi:single-stranded-DNA-specific exonuclease